MRLPLPLDRGKSSYVLAAILLDIDALREIAPGTQVQIKHVTMQRDAPYVVLESGNPCATRGRRPVLISGRRRQLSGCWLRHHGIFPQLRCYRGWPSPERRSRRGHPRRRFCPDRTPQRRLPDRCLAGAGTLDRAHRLRSAARRLWQTRVEERVVIDPARCSVARPVYLTWQIGSRIQTSVT
jgi:hypothetical protein